MIGKLFQKRKVRAMTVKDLLTAAFFLGMCLGPLMIMAGMGVLDVMGVHRSDPPSLSEGVLVVVISWRLIAFDRGRYRATYAGNPRCLTVQEGDDTDLGTQSQR